MSQIRGVVKEVREGAVKNDFLSHLEEVEGWTKSHQGDFITTPIIVTVFALLFHNRIQWNLC